MQIPRCSSEGSGADAEVKFWNVPVQRLGLALEGYGAHRFRKVPVERLSGGSGRFRRRC